MTEQIQRQIKQQISEAFEAMSRRNTRPRRILQNKLVDLSRSGETFALDELWAELREENAGIGRATVFRTVEWLVQSEVIDRIEFADGTRRYRVCGGSHHHHLACTCCHRVIEIGACLSNSTLEAIAERNDFQIDGHSLTLYGICSDCRRGSYEGELETK